MSKITDTSGKMREVDTIKSVRAESERNIAAFTKDGGVFFISGATLAVLRELAPSIPIEDLTRPNWRGATSYRGVDPGEHFVANRENVRKVLPRSSVARNVDFDVFNTD